MSNLDPLIAEILLKGDDEFLSKLRHVGEEAENNFGKLQAAASSGAEPLNLLADRLLYVVAAISGVTAATTMFIEQQTALSQRAELLSEAFGVTSSQLQGLEKVFASSGVKVEQFERFANRLTITIAREWPQIAESIKNYATENDAATLRVSSAILRIKDAQNAVFDNAENRSSEMEKTYLSLRGATATLASAQQHLSELQGGPALSDYAKKQLDIDKARLAVANAQQAQADLQRKAAKEAREDAEQFVKDQNAVKSAIIARSEAEASAAKLALTNVASIRDSLDSIAKGEKGAATEIDLTQVSVQNLTRSIIAQAAETTKEKSGTPSGYETMIALSETFSKATKEQITQEQKLAIVNRLTGSSMQSLGISAAEILNVLEHDTVELKKFEDAAKAIDTKEARKAIEDFRGALAGLNLDFSLLSQKFAIAAAPAFTAFLNSIKESLTSSTGLLHIFGEGIRGIGSAVGAIIQGWQKLGEIIESAIGNGIEKGTAMKAMLLLLAGFVAAFSTSWVAIPVAIGLAVVAIGYVVEHMKDIQKWAEENRAKFVAIGVVIGGIAALIFPWITAITLVIAGVVVLYENWDKVTAAIGRAWKAVQDTAVYQFLDGVITRLKEAYDWWSKLGTKTTPNNPDKGSNAGTGGGNVEGHAAGGMIDGPGSTTSDSILARLSRGEFVTRAAAVQKYGSDFFHSLNNMTLPGFAMGGLVPAPVRMSGGGGSGPATSTVNLSIDGRSFGSLRGSKSTVDDLSAFAISRQTSAAGSNPSWMK
jgi:hypothetical protein